MKKIILILAAILVLAAPGCRKEFGETPQAEERWLRVYHAGVFEDSINVTGWEKNEDVVEIDRYYYPWQGEDSINYSFYLPSYDTTVFRPYSYLVVNDRLAGVDPFSVHIESIPNKAEVLTLMRYDSNFKLLPNLAMMAVVIYFADDTNKLDSIPCNIRLDVVMAIQMYPRVDCVPAVLAKISRFRNVRVLEMSLTEKEIDGDLSLIRRLCRMRGLRRVEIHVPEATTEWEGTKIESRLRCLPKLKAVELRKYMILETG